MTSCPKCHRDVLPDATVCASCGASVAAAELRDPFIGQTLKGTYFVEMRIGGGGMGDVYRARHVTLDAPIALKILKRSLLSDPSIVQRFHREARAASRLRHANIISVTDFGQNDDGTLYMAMEYVAGKSLARVIAEEFPLSEPRIVAIGQQILSALAEAHAGQILHRDLKPENVMLESRRSAPDVVKVLDFGIAKIQISGERGVTLTQEGLVCGTPGYMSPEQWSGETLDARSDLYSVGVILYEMLTGRLPFEARTPMELLRKHLTEKVVPPSGRRDGGAVSPDLEGLVMRALSPSREERAGSAESMRSELLACVLREELDSGLRAPAWRRTVAMNASSSRESQEVAEVRAPAVLGPARRRSRVPLAAGAVVAAIALLGGGSYLTVRGREQRRAVAQRAEEAAARLRTEEEARRRAEAEASLRSADDTRRRAEEDARRQADEARRRADEARKRRVAEERQPRGDRFASRSKLYSFPLPNATDGKGVLSINAEPPGGTVLVGDVAYGAAPLEVLVPAGSYRVRIRFKGGERAKLLKVHAGTREPWTAIFNAE
jgi:serine/threonine-protein kinase